MYKRKEVVVGFVDYDWSVVVVVVVVTVLVVEALVGGVGGQNQRQGIQECLEQAVGSVAAPPGVAAFPELLR